MEMPTKEQQMINFVCNSITELRMRYGVTARYALMGRDELDVLRAAGVLSGGPERFRFTSHNGKVTLPVIPVAMQTFREVV